MYQYFQISKYFLLALLGIFFVAALIAIGTPPQLALHTIALHIGTITIMVSPVVIIATLITGMSSMQHISNQKKRLKRKMSDFQQQGFQPDPQRIEYILSQLEPEDRAYLEYYYAMRGNEHESRLNADYLVESASTQQQFTA